MNYIDKVSKAKKGDKKAFQDLLAEEKTKLYKIAYIYMKNEDEALEVFQETVCKALSSIHTLRENKYFYTWITKILINTAIKELQKKKKVIPMEQEALLSNTKAEYQAEINTDILEAIKLMEERYKTVLILRYYKDYSIKQIAEILQYPEGTVKTNIHRGLGLLRVQLEEECVNE
ncbi:sigma-70 family RNA polymerase sigma factor [Rossellomorea vietnamensis]|uniref:Sigma-70 family RNA polymerase sigma factor n=1 Tax=Rossellomorea vietnamensis TaxID=218284 RepID=A0A5D4KEW9_9BACI|nr:sigma-70 family RNA polymerase sigma factor [Rossellomorea vietnamensis]TYR75851.1 sigma-70 family RNA polymerase sigma factor [Rossellomorea vietnamensis]